MWMWTEEYVRPVMVLIHRRIPVFPARTFGVPPRATLNTPTGLGGGALLLPETLPEHEIHGAAGLCTRRAQKHPQFN